MLVAHKILDALQGRPNAMPLKFWGGNTSVDDMKHYLKFVTDGLLAAEKFDFGQLFLEPGREPGSFALPALTPDELQAWSEGLLPLPGPVCWYEYVLGNSRSGLLIAENAAGWSATRIDWPVTPPWELLLDGVWASLDRHEALGYFGGHLPARVLGNSELIESLSRDEIGKFFSDVIAMPLYLTLMLNSASTEISHETPPPKLNRARQKRGVTPLLAHRIVRIVPEKYLRERRAEAGLTRLPPRLHYRRSHIRTLHRGTSAERRILIPRFLVGKGEAEVSHEYRIMPSSQLQSGRVASQDRSESSPLRQIRMPSNSEGATR